MAKTCNRCGRDLDKTGHSLTCPAGQVIKKIDEGANNETIKIIFPNDDLKAEYGEMMARTALQMAATKTFFDACTEIDEEAPDFIKRLGPHLEKFVVDMFLIYPNPNLFDSDLNTLLGKVEE